MVGGLQELFDTLDFHPNEDQLEAIENVEGPMLITAGPGSGKTMVLVLRALNLLLFHDVKPSEILVCTFTEKAAATLKDRITRALRDVGKEMDLTELSVGTVHSICNSLIEEFLDSTHLNRGYEVLNDLTQILFLHEHYYQIIRHPDPLARAHWPSIEVAAEYFNRITEECVDPEDLAQSEDEYLERIATLYKRYEDELREANSVDFAHLQSIVLELLRDSESGPKLKERFRYVMVDEYQDTNYIQERLFLELVKDTSNLCVVGDEDQSLYRFRGATVQNILQFPNHFDEISLVNLGTNYRSTPGIIEFVSNFIHDGTWTDATGKEYRYDKPLEAFRPSLDNSVPSVYVTNEPEPREVARFIKRILQSNAVSDLNQIAILLRSVKRDGPAFFRALEAESVPYYAPRAQRFMQLPIVRLVIGTLIETLSYDVQDCWNDELRDFYDECKSMLLSDGSNELMDSIAQESQAINALEVGGSLKKGIVDLFYEALGKEPFLSGLRDEVGARCIAMLTDYLTKFQEYYRLPVIRENTIKKIRRNLFNSYLYVLWRQGLNEYEDPYDVFPPGYVQVMTIHQAKGLEFPVIVVGSLHKGIQVKKKIDRELRPHRPRVDYEPEDLLTEFDHYRLFYVAFSRAMDVLVLSVENQPHDRVEAAVERARELSPNITDLENSRFRIVRFEPPKSEYSVAGDIHAFDVCPQQYLYYNHYGFVPTRGAGQMFGTLVHRTIEDVHRHYLKNQSMPKEDEIKGFFHRNYMVLSRGGVHPLAKLFRDMAWEQVIRYVRVHSPRFDRLVRAEEPVSIDQGDYIINGTVDLIRDETGGLDLIDFKAQESPDEDESSDRLEFYKFQLALYTHLIGKKMGEMPKRTYIYWTAEEDPVSSMQEIPSGDIPIEESLSAFDERVRKIEAGDFEICANPPRDVCRNCDLRHWCPTGHSVLGVST